MPDFNFSITVSGITVARAGQIRDRLVQRLGEDAVTATVVNVAQVTEDFRVIGVDVTTREVIDEMVEATGPAAARTNATAANPNLVIVTVRTVRP